MQSTQPAGALRTLAIVCAVFLSGGMVLASFGPSLPRLAANVGQDIAALGTLFTAISGGVVLAQFGAGPGSDRFGQRVVLAAGMLLMGGGTVVATLASGMIALLAGALIAGIGFGGVLAAGNLLVARLFSSRSAAALNGVNLFFGVGSMLGPALAGLAAARLASPQVALWAGSGLLFALAPLVLALAAAPPPAHAGAAGSAAAAPQQRTLWLLALLLLVYTGIEVGFGGWVTIYMTEGANLTPSTAALVASGFWLALTSGRALGAALGLRLAPQTLLAACLLGVLGGATLLATGVGDLARSVAGVLVLGLTCGPVFPTVLSMVAAAARGSSAAASRVLALGNGGGLIVPALLGLLLSRYGPAAMAGLVLGLALAMAGFCAAVLWAGAPIQAIGLRPRAGETGQQMATCDE